MLKDRGYTLVELLVVIAVIAVLVGMLLVAINPQRVITDTRDARNRTEMNQVKTALQLYFNDNNAYPANTSLLVPAYAKALPGVTTDASFQYGSSGADYDAGVNLNNPTSDDTATRTKCRNDGSTLADGNYMICPD